MGLPLFSASDDPGPSFFHFAQSSGLTPPVSNASAASAHATTVIAVRYDGGVVMVGDRQATGNYIAVTFERSKRRTGSRPSPFPGRPRAVSSSSAWRNSPSSTTRR